MFRLFQKIKQGDIVLYDNPERFDPKHRNMLTKVLWTSFWSGSACIRFEGTTHVVSVKHLQVIRVSEFPLRVPMEPRMEVFQSGQTQNQKSVPAAAQAPDGWQIQSPGNQAGFSPIPLDWFDYALPSQ